MILQGDCREVLPTLPAGSVQTCVTSPPYFNLRDYGHDGQIGLEETPEEYVANMVSVFREVRRVLRDDGVLWINLGDSFAAGKQLLGIPWRVAFALQADGWYLRSEIIWHKPNPMPESVTDRPTKAHEQVFLLSKSPRYFYDAESIKEPNASPEQYEHNQRYAKPYAAYDANATVKMPGRENSRGIHARPGGVGRNARSVWTIATQPFTGWAPAVRRYPVAWDDVSDDTKRTPSEDCRVHASLDRQRPTLECDARAGGNYYRSHGSATHPVRVPLVDYAPTVLHHVLSLTTESSGSARRSRSPSATRRNSQSRKTDPDLLTSSPCTPSAQSDSHTEHTSGEPAPSEHRPGTPESKTAAGGSGDSRDTKSPVGTAGNGQAPALIEASFGEALRAAGCTCSYYTERTEEVSHFAVFPPELARRCILAGSAVGDTVLDPFGGSGTVAHVAQEHGRRSVIIELNPDYVRIAERRTAQSTLWVA